MNEVFYWCVRLLQHYAKVLGMTYEEINVWLFVILEPLFIILLLAVLSGVDSTSNRCRHL